MPLLARPTPKTPRKRRVAARALPPMAIVGSNVDEKVAGVTDIEAGAILVFDVPFPHAGQYRFEITVDGEILATVPITVTQLQNPPPGPVH